MSRIYRRRLFRELKLNESSKCDDGFIKSMLVALHERCLDSVRNMEKPRGFHIELTEIDRSKVGYIPRVISRWVESRRNCSLSFMTGKYHFIKAEEIRPRTSEFHIHLHLIVDCVTYSDIQSLREALLPVASMVKLKSRSLQSRPVYVNPTTGECVINNVTGNFVRAGCAWSHELKSEFSDYFERASYICKVRTKLSMSSWSCSRIR